MKNDTKEKQQQENLNLKHKQTCENVKQAIVTNVMKLYEKIQFHSSGGNDENLKLLRLCGGVMKL